ncbi:MAG: DUF6502 family protein [Woeseiaceae bacterium]
MVDNTNKQFLVSACRAVLRPLLSMLLKCGMTFREFSDISKSVFVETASKDYGIDGRPTNVSRVSILTGISRKEVKRQRDILGSSEDAVTRKTNDATKLLSGWHQDNAFLGEDGKPALLTTTGANTSFAQLCDKYGGDVPPTTMLKELIKTGCVEPLAGGELRALKRYYQPAIHDEENLLFAVDRIRDVISTMNNNVFPEENGALRFGGYADNERIPVQSIPAFHEWLDKRGQAFLEEVDDWLTENAEEPAGNQECARVGVSLFATQR